MIRDAVDFNPFRYCGEYYDTNTGRFISQDPHWNVKNMIYGDNPDDKNPVPDLVAIIQSGNLYAYCLDKPTSYQDKNGQFAFLLQTAFAGAVAGGIIGGIVAAKIRPHGGKVR